jgi:D-sedoheptulose 7-phosphate isomerase
MRILQRIDLDTVERLAVELKSLRQRGGRLFIVGNGGGAGHASHAVNDFRKLSGIEAYTPSDNASELTARTNDDGWETTYVEWLKVSRLGRRDMLFVLSVGGGDEGRNISPNIVRALEYGRAVGATISGIVGRDGGATARLGTFTIVVPTVDPENLTAQTEGVQSVLCHLLVSHPGLRLQVGKWESER